MVRNSILESVNSGYPALRNVYHERFGNGKLIPAQKVGAGKKKTTSKKSGSKTKKVGSKTMQKRGGSRVKKTGSKTKKVGSKTRKVTGGEGRPLTAYQMFVRKEMARWKKDKPKSYASTLNTERMKIVAAKWRKMKK